MRAWLYAVALLLAGCDEEPPIDSDPGTQSDTATDTGSEPAEPLSWDGDVWPVLNAKCHPCHDKRDRDFPGFFLTNNQIALESLLNDPPNEPERFARYIDPGQPDTSLLLDKVLAEPTYGGDTMPRGREPLTADEINTIRWWIAQGAKDD